MGLKVYKRGGEINFLRDDGEPAVDAKQQEQRRPTVAAETMDDPLVGVNNALKIHMNHPLFLIRRVKDGDVWMYTFRIAPFRFTKSSAILEARRYVDNGVVSLPLIVHTDDKDRVQNCIDTGVAYAIYSLALLLMGDDAASVIHQVQLFNSDSGEFQPAAFDLFMRTFWSAFPMYSVTATTTEGVIEGQKRSPIIISWSPMTPWYKEDGEAVEFVPVPDNVAIDPVDLKLLYDRMLKAGYPVFDVQCAIKDMLMNEILNRIYNGKTVRQSVAPVAKVGPELQTRNLSAMFKEKLKEMGVKHGPTE